MSAMPSARSASAGCSTSKPSGVADRNPEGPLLVPAIQQLVTKADTHGRDPERVFKHAATHRCPPRLDVPFIDGGAVLKVACILAEVDLARALTDFAGANGLLAVSRECAALRQCEPMKRAALSCEQVPNNQKDGVGFTRERVVERWHTVTLAQCADRATDQVDRVEAGILVSVPPGGGVLDQLRPGLQRHALEKFEQPAKRFSHVGQRGPHRDACLIKPALGLLLSLGTALGMLLGAFPAARARALTGALICRSASSIKAFTSMIGFPFCIRRLRPIDV
jgi:hypothetical protein